MNITQTIDAHLHHEGRRRGKRLTRKEWTEEVNFRGRAQSLSDLEAGRMPDGHSRKLGAEALVRRKVERGVEALEAELVELLRGQAGSHSVGIGTIRRLARLAARHLYGMDDEKGGTP